MSFDWDTVWDNKGKAVTNDPLVISGFEKLPSVDSKAAANTLLKLLNIQPSDSILEIGCGAGVLARHLHLLCTYVGTDRSASMVKKNIELNNLSVLRCDADDIIFKDKSFDHVFAFGVFHYFPNHEYAAKCISEMKRVARKSICISDLPEISHDPNHLLFDKKLFSDWHITDSFYKNQHPRYTATLYLG